MGLCFKDEAALWCLVEGRVVVLIGVLVGVLIGWEVLEAAGAEADVAVTV